MDKETIITNNGLIRPAATDAWPMTIVPTIPIAGPICLGSRILASLRISATNSIKNASKKALKGTDSS